MNGFWFALGLVIVCLSLASVLFVLVLPRQAQGVQRVSLAVNGAVRSAFLALSRFARSYEQKDWILAAVAPIALVTQLLVWAAMLIVGYGLMLVGSTRSVPGGLLQAIGALFTVGAIHPGGRADVAIDVAAGATWVVIVALQIAYLPALYSAYSRREALVTLLEGRAGTPAWGPELLARHQLVGIADTLPELYSSWEEWAAEVTESHTTYPILMHFRSPEPWLSWPIGLLAVLDAGAMQLALCPHTAPSEARLCLRMGFTALNRLARSLNWEVDADPSPTDPIELTFEEYEQAVELLSEARFPMELSAKESWADFRGWRVNYERSAYLLCDHLTAPPAPWSGPRRVLPGGITPPRRPPHRSPHGNEDPAPDAPERLARALPGEAVRAAFSRPSTAEALSPVQYED